jgi:putative salt-induced outer membrane protein
MARRRRICSVVSLAFSLAVASVPATAAEEESPWKVRSQIAYVRTDGNTDTQTFAGTAEISLDLTPNRYFLTGGVLFAQDQGDTTASRKRFTARYERAITDRFFAFLDASYLKDTFAGFDSKIAVGPGLGYDLVKTEDHLLKGGVAVLQTWDNTTEDETDSYATGKAILDYTWQILENLKFTQYLDYLVSFEDSDRYFVNSLSQVEVAVNSIFSLATGYGINYQNDPPGDKDETDTRFFTSLIVDF